MLIIVKIFALDKRGTSATKTSAQPLNWPRKTFLWQSVWLRKWAMLSIPSTPTICPKSFAPSATRWRPIHVKVFWTTKLIHIKWTIQNLRNNSNCKYLKLYIDGVFLSLIDREWLGIIFKIEKWHLRSYFDVKMTS